MIRRIQINNYKNIFNMEQHYSPQHPVLTTQSKRNPTAKRDGETLTDRLETLSSIYTSMSDGLALHEIIYDSTGKAVDYLVTEVNPAYEKITGLKQTAVVGKKATKIYAMDEAPYIDIYAEVASTGNPSSFEIYFPPKDKHFSVSAFSHAKGKFGTIFQDITEQKKAGEELRKNEEKYKELVTNAKSIILTLDNEGRFTFINEYGQSFFEYKEHELIGKRVVETIVPKIDSTGRDMDELLEDILENPESYSININENIKKNGERVWVEWHNKTLYDDNGNRTGHLSIGMDITVRHDAELIIEEKNKELLLAKEKAEENDHLKSAFLRNMSHEIRTPMNAIIGFSKMLDKEELSVEERKSFTSIIIHSTNQLLSIVTDVLTFSSIQTNQEKITIKDVTINSIIDDLHSIFKTQASDQNITLIAKKELSDSQSEIYTDCTKVTQILTNFITNALKFTHEGFIEFGYSLKNDFLEFYVKDCGIGIKEECQKLIFERFKQANEDIRKKYGGTGLGLAISKAFTELLGGKIWVQSESDKGSTFYFTIPYNPVHEEMEQPQPSETTIITS